MKISKIVKGKFFSIVAANSGGTPKKVAVVLSGCGAYDGTEITEAVCTTLAIEKCNASPTFFAPNILQCDVVNHLKTNVEALLADNPTLEKQESRNVLIESARIARGAVYDLKAYDQKNFEALVFVGGFGAAKNLSSFAFDGVQCRVLPEVENAVNQTYAAQKPLGFICISPASIAAPVLGKHNVELTIGCDEQTAKAVEHFGARHIVCSPESFVKDSNSKVYSTPAFMCAQSSVQVARGIESMIKAMLK